MTDKEEGRDSFDPITLTNIIFFFCTLLLLLCLSLQENNSYVTLSSKTRILTQDQTFEGQFIPSKWASQKAAVHCLHASQDQSALKHWPVTDLNLRFAVLEQ